MAFSARGGDNTKYVLGRGKLYLQGDVKRSGTASSSPVPWRDIGNVTAFAIAQESETKDHRSFLSGIAVIDKQVPISQKMTISFTTDEAANMLNLAHFLSGDLENDGMGFGPTVFNPVALASDFLPGVVVMAEHFFVDTATTDHIYDLWYDITLNIAGFGETRCYDFAPAQTVLVEKQNANRTSAGTALTAGTHYELDRKMGRVRFFNVAGGITRNDTFRVSWAASADATKANGFDTLLNRIKILTKSGLTVGVKFVQENPNNSDNQTEYGFHRVQLKPEGEFSGIGDDWAGLGFSGAVEAITSPPQGTSIYGWVVNRDVYGA